MKELVLILISISTIACSKSDQISIQDNIDRSFEFSVFNSDNEDLLDNTTSNHIIESEIRLFYEENGEVSEVYNANLDYPRNFFIFKHENEYRIRVFLNSTESSEKPITIIQWNENDSDTIETVFERPGNSILKRHVWFNDLKVWDWTLDQEEYYMILK
jgi:hypothetical protein